ncbi:hypothetical protein SAMN05216360_101447 [Methylobacterium phyllostachyos]|uniref:Uncharacterized protein n=1 Tax=Methylobacterium phyllostachyos TaxID=582672 RepID=A0A1G9S0C1_9HYPH|nr:hypothetical protein SAMN05216360_101447 [Methylobacterium phyllostachyos]
MAIVALMVMGLDAKAAVEAVAMAVPEASPNRLVLRHAEAILGGAIVVHAQCAWLYRRGPSGAQREVRAEVGPIASPPWECAP